MTRGKSGVLGIERRLPDSFLCMVNPAYTVASSCSALSNHMGSH